MAQDQLILALDYGGTKLTAALARAGERQWLALERSVSPPQHDGDYERATMSALARKLLGGARPAAIGVSFGGPVDASGRLVFLSHHIAGWENVPLCAQLEAEFGAPAAMANDGNVGALGEYVFGAGVCCRSLLYVTVSTGVGGGWILDGKIWRCADAMAGEIGHTIYDARGPECVCGRRGCVEAMACGPAIARDARARGLQLDSLTGESVARAANAGDELARAVMDDAARALGFGIGTAITLINPTRVVIGGGVLNFSMFAPMSLTNGPGQSDPNIVWSAICSRRGK